MKNSGQSYLFLSFFVLAFTCSCRNTSKKGNDVETLLAQPPFAVITDSIKQFPKNAGLYLERALLLSKNNLHEVATNDYAKAWELQPDEIVAIQYASNLSITNDTDKELHVLQNALQQFPDNNQIKQMLGDTYVEAGKNKEALELYDNFIKKDSNDFESWYEKGMLLAKMNDTVHAIEALQKTYSIQPTSTYALELAHLYAETNNAAALEICDQVISKDSARELIDPFFIKGIYYSNTKQYEAAMVQFDSCIRRDWKFNDAYIEKGIALFKQKNYDVAMNTFRMAATVSNTNADAYFWIGRCYEAINKKDDAIEYYQKAAALDKNFTEAKDAIKRLKS
ncbi:MAG: tetratricopeptide repeat protein [Bacteroidetes bacterium]|nr:tetratricopeptide repeat protein [Bacteroidota bacterium]